jgi:hypothetical protein
MAGILSVGPVSLIVRRGGIPIQPRAAHASPNAPFVLWRSLVGAAFSYAAANYNSVTWYLEVYVRSTSAKSFARLWDVTAAAAVANSTVTIDAGAIGVLLVPTRVRSSALTLVDGHEYRVQYGVEDIGSGAAVSARLIVIAP